MKNLFIIISMLIVGFLFYHLYIWGNYGNGYYITQPNRTILQKKDDKNFFISNILNIKESQQYLLVLRMPENFYTCLHTSIVVCDPILKFSIINKEKNYIYETENYKRFNKKLKELKIDKMFSIKEIKKAQKKVLANENICNNKKITNDCTEDYVYEIKRF